MSRAASTGPTTTEKLLGWLGFVLVLALATLLRVYRLDLLDLRFDEASGLQNALTVAGGTLLKVATFSGSVAVHPPAYAYTMALPYLVTRDFITIAAARAALDVIAIAGLWLVCARSFNMRTAFLAALLFAVAPWAVQFARKTWLAPLPLYHVILLWGLLEVAHLRRARGWAISGLGLALSIGTHLSAVYLLPVTLIALWIGRRTFRPLPALLGLLPLLGLAVLYLTHDAPGGFANVRALLGAAGFGAPDDRAVAASAGFSLQSLRFALWITGGAHLSDLTSGAFAAWQAQLPAWLDNIDTLQMALLIASVALLALAIVRRSPQWPAATVLLLAWTLLPIVLQLRPSRPLQMHYLLVLYPAPFVLMAMALDQVLRLGRVRVIKAALTLTLAVIVGWQAFTTLRFADFVERYDTSNGGYGPPVRAALAAAQLAREAVWRGEAPDVIVVAPGGDPAVNEQAAVMDVLLADVPRRFVRAEDGLIVRGDAAQYVFTPDAQAPLDALRALAAPGDLLARRLAVYDGDARVFTQAQLPRVALTAYQPQSALWANGAYLIGYRAAREGEVLALDAYMSVTRQPGEDYHWFARALAGEKQVAAVDIGGVHPSAWRVGDVLVLRFRLPIPADAGAVTAIRLGAYEYPAIAQTPVLDAAGNPADDGVTLTLAP